MTDSYQQSLSEQMREKETKELLEIWNAQDLKAWTPEAFEIVHSIILERLGTVPEPDSLLINMLLDDIHTEVEEEIDLYYQPKRLVGLALTINKMAWVILGLYILFVLGEIARIVVIYTSTPQDITSVFISLFSICLTVASGIFYFFLFRILSELSFLWMDIESNGRKMIEAVSRLINK